MFESWMDRGYLDRALPFGRSSLGPGLFPVAYSLFNFNRYAICPPRNRMQLVALTEKGHGFSQTVVPSSRFPADDRFPQKKHGGARAVDRV